MINSNKPVYGIGFKGNDYPSYDGEKQLKEYSLWCGMLYRCTEKHWASRPTYTGTTCSENFKSYTFFYEWCNKQIGFNNRDENGRGWPLDKDLLTRGNKCYSEDTCCFVPQKLNALIVNRSAARGEYPVGVYWNTGNRRYIAKCSRGASKQTHLGSFNTPQEAFQAYKTFKEALIKEVANEYKEMLDSRVYEALMNYEVNEND